jgi:hypothetical protein
MIWRQYRSRCPYDGADGVVHGLGFGLLHGGFERRAGCCDGVVGRDGRVRLEVVVVVCCCAYDGAGLYFTVSLIRIVPLLRTYLAVFLQVDCGVVWGEGLVG